MSETETKLTYTVSVEDPQSISCDVELTRLDEGWEIRFTITNPGPCFINDIERYIEDGYFINVTNIDKTCIIIVPNIQVEEDLISIQVQYSVIAGTYYTQDIIISGLSMESPQIQMQEAIQTKLERKEL